MDLRDKTDVKFIETPREILQAQLKAWDQVIEQKSAENPFFRQGAGIAEDVHEARGGLPDQVRSPDRSLPTSISSARRKSVNAPLFAIDRLSAWVGKACAWCIVGSPRWCATTWWRATFSARRRSGAWTSAYMLYGTLFMMAGAYTLSRNGHVRGDVLYRFLPPRTQAATRSRALPAVLHARHQRPGLVRDRVRRRFVGHAEQSQTTSNGLPRVSVEDGHPVGGRAAAAAGFGRDRCAASSVCAHGEWPQRLHDVEEARHRRAEGRMAAGYPGRGTRASR